VWGVHVPSVKAAYSLDARWLAVVLLASSLGSVSSLFFAGRVVGRFGARNTTAIAAALFCSALAASLILPGTAALFALMFLFGASESVYDVAINAEGSTLEQMTGRAVMSGFHGMFSLGAMIGSATAAGMLRARIPAPTQLLLVGAVVAVSAAIASRGMLEAHPKAGDDEAHFAWPSGTLLIIGGLICAGMLAEGVMYNWSVLYVQQELHTPQERAALAYVAFSAATSAMRFAGDSVRARVSERAILIGGASVASVAMAVVLLIAQPWVAYVGFAIVGTGLATVVPILYNAATRVPGVSRAAAIASASSIGYVGFMIGPPTVGAIADATSLSWAMCSLIVASLVLIAGARVVPLSEP
jgi:MFS family permease